MPYGTDSYGTVTYGGATGQTVTEYFGSAQDAAGGTDTVAVVIYSTTTATGSRVRSGVPLPQQAVYNTATGARRRLGAAFAAIIHPITATGARVRRGIGLPIATTVIQPPPQPPVPGPGPGYGPYPVPVLPEGGMDYRRWRFTDPVDNSSYIFEFNPNAGGSASAKRPLTPRATTAADGAPLVFEGEADVLTSEISGTLRSKEQYDAFVAWFNKHRPVIVTDDIGRSSFIAITRFSTQRRPTHNAPFRQNYTLSYSILKRVGV